MSKQNAKRIITPCRALTPFQHTFAQISAERKHSKSGEKHQKEKYQEKAISESAERIALGIEESVAFGAQRREVDGG